MHLDHAIQTIPIQVWFLILPIPPYQAVVMHPLNLSLSYTYKLYIADSLIF